MVRCKALGNNTYLQIKRDLENGRNKTTKMMKKLENHMIYVMKIEA